MIRVLEWAVAALLGVCMGAWVESVRIEQQCAEFGAFKMSDTIYRCQPADVTVTRAERMKQVVTLSL